MPNHLTIFGSAAGYPTKRRPHTTAIGLWRGEELYLFDTGAGIAHQFAVLDIDADALQAIFLTHTHADHVGGLAPLIQSIQLNKRTKMLPLYVPDRSLDGLRDYLHFVYLYPQAEFDLELHPVAEGFSYEADGIMVEAVPSHHLEPGEERRRRNRARAESQAFSYRISADGKRIYISGDIDSPQEAAKHGAGCDLAVVEIAHFEPEALGEALGGSEIARLVVTHVIESLESVEGELPHRIRAGGFEGEIVVATDGLEVSF